MAQEYLIFVRQCILSQVRESDGRVQGHGTSIMFLGPYSFNMAAVEKLFSFVKNRDLNPLATRAYSR
jgi:hypothetical protein